jgi:hypothetical protein
MLCSTSADCASMPGARPGPVHEQRSAVFLQLCRWFPSIVEAMTTIRPETLVRWHRAGFCRYWRWKSGNLGGRPPIDAGLRPLIRQMSIENVLWGAPRIQGELFRLGFAVAESTVDQVHGQERRPRQGGNRNYAHCLHSCSGPGLVRLNKSKLPSTMCQFLSLSCSSRSVLSRRGRSTSHWRAMFYALHPCALLRQHYQRERAPCDLDALHEFRGIVEIAAIPRNTRRCMIAGSSSARSTRQLRSSPSRENRSQDPPYES